MAKIYASTLLKAYERALRIQLRRDEEKKFDSDWVDSHELVGYLRYMLTEVVGSEFAELVTDTREIAEERP